MDTSEDDSKKSNLSSSIMDDITAAATGYADYKKNKDAANLNNQNKDIKDAKKDSAKSSLSSAENSALKPTGANNNSPLASARSAESSPSNLYTGTGRPLNGPTNSKSQKSGIKKALPLALIGILAFGIMALVFILQPIMKLGTIVRNLSTALGFDHGTALLEEKCEYVTSEMAMNGEINEDFYSRLAENNIEVGQVTVAGEFVKTNTYLAYLDEDIASTEDNYQSDKKGALSFRFNDKIIEAENFVAAVESDPVLYSAFSKALNVSANFHYSDEVEKVYNQMGITRAEFIDYEETDDDKENYENFSKMVTDFLDKGNETTIEVVLNQEEKNGYEKDCRSGEKISIYTNSQSDGAGLASAVDDATSIYNYDYNDPIMDEEGNIIGYPCVRVSGSEHQNEASALLSTALSSLEPQLATKAFMVIAEPIQQVQAGDNGPINQLMNMLDVTTPVSVVGANGGTVDYEESIMTNSNFLAAITFEDYDAKEAADFSRDRFLTVTGAGDLDILKKSNTATPKQQSASKNDYYENTSVNGLLGGTSGDTLSDSLYKKKSETFTSAIGANQIVKGGAYLSNSVNSVIGALSSDSTAVAKYQKEVNDVFARQAAAERATLAWYDISSENTFLGSIVHNFATAMTYFSAKTSGGFSLSAIPESVASVTKNSLASITGLVSADNYEDGYLGTNGTNCTTINELNYGLVGDIYCTEHKTIDTEYLDWTLQDFRGGNSKISEWINDDGSIKEKEGGNALLEVLILGADRTTSVGVSNSELCQRYPDFQKGILKRGVAKLKRLFGVSCDELSKDSQSVADGSKYTISDANSDNKEVVQQSSAYALYQMANKIVGNANQVSIAKEKYYAKHPLDNSEAGYIARISGMTKEQAEIALAYADYLTYLAKYDPSTRYSFINPAGLESSPLDSLEFNEELANTYALVSKEIAYSDIRNRLVALS